MSSKRKSSMASVWDTLNAMKARQEAAMSFTKGRVQSDEAREKMCSIFQEKIDALVQDRFGRVLSSSEQGGNSPYAREEVRALLSDFRSECKSNTAVALFEKECTQKAQADPARELQNLKHLLRKAEHSLSLSRHKIQRSKQIENKLNTS